jgi:uncharacterized protein (TIGR02996 family)
MDAEERALLAAIIAQPDDDTARLVYADWLQEHGREERAELIRAQVGLARPRQITETARQRSEWSTRERLLLQTRAERWRKELPSLRGVDWGWFERGMVQSVRLSVRRWDAAFSASLAGIFGHTPLRVLRIDLGPWRSHSADECDEMLRWDGLSRFDEVHFIAPFARSGAVNPFVTRMWAIRWPERPRIANLHECKLSDDAVCPLLDSPADSHFPSLVFDGGGLSAQLRADVTARFAGRVQFV